MRDYREFQSLQHFVAVPEDQYGCFNNAGKSEHWVDADMTVLKVPKNSVLVASDDTDTYIMFTAPIWNDVQLLQCDEAQELLRIAVDERKRDVKEEAS